MANVLDRLITYTRKVLNRPLFSSDFLSKHAVPTTLAKPAIFPQTQRESQTLDKPAVFPQPRPEEVRARANVLDQLLQPTRQIMASIPQRASQFLGVSKEIAELARGTIFSGGVLSLEPETRIWNQLMKVAGADVERSKIAFELRKSLGRGLTLKEFRQIRLDQREADPSLEIAEENSAVTIGLSFGSGLHQFGMTEGAARKILKIPSKLKLTKELINKSWKKLTLKTHPDLLKPKARTEATRTQQMVNSTKEFLDDIVNKAPKPTPRAITGAVQSEGKPVTEALRRVETKPTPKPTELDPTKFKTAEEFVGGKFKLSDPDVYLHATTKEGIEGIEKSGFKSALGKNSAGHTTGKGVWLYGEANDAIRFSKSSPFGDIDGKLIAARVEGKIFKVDSILKSSSDLKLIKKLKEDGFVGMTGNETLFTQDQALRPIKSNATFIFDESAIKTKSQLTDIFNKAKAPSITEQLKAQVPTKPITQAITKGEKFLRGVERDITRGITKKRFTQAQKAKQQVKAGARGEKVGERTGQKILSEFKKDIRDQRQTVQQIKNDIISKAEDILPLRERGKLLRSIKNAKSFDDLTESLNRIERLGQAGEIRDLKFNIKKELKKTKVKKQAGKPVGKFTPEIQVTLDKLREISKLSKLDAQEKITANLTKFGDQLPPPSVALENRLLDMMGGVEQMGVRELEQALRDIQSIKSEGQTLRDLKRFNLESQFQANQEMAVDVITGGAGLPADIKTTGIQEIKPKTLKAKIDRLTQRAGLMIVNAWRDTIDTLAFYDKPSKPRESRLSKWADVREVENVEKALREDWFKKLQTTVKTSYNLKTDRQARIKLTENSKIEESLGKFKNTKGVTTELKFTKDQAIKRWMELQDPSLEETFRAGMNYTDEMIEAINKFLSPQDKAFGQGMLDFYKVIYPQINEVYSELYGVNLPNNQFYSPIRREGIKSETDKGFGEFLQEMKVRRSIAPGATKSRVENIKPIKKQGAILSAQMHVEEMGHFIAWARKMRELRNTFDNPDVKAAIEIYFGKSLLRETNRILDGFVTRGQDMANNLGWLDKLRSNTITSQLGLKPSIGTKQLLSIPAFWEDVPTQDFIAGIIDFFKSPKKKWKILNDSSVLIRTRGEHMTRDIKTAAQSDQFHAFVANPTLKNSLLLFTRLGDKGAIVVGSWSEYRYLTKVKGWSHEKAISKIEQSTADAQQSGDLSQLSRLQQGNSFMKLLTMYANSPIQYTRKVLGAVRNIAAGRGDVKKHLKTIFIYWTVLPILFQWVSDFFRTDDEEWKNLARAGIVGPMNRVFYYGDVAVAMTAAAMGSPVYDAESPVFDLKTSAVRLVTAMRKLFTEDDISFEEFMDILKTGAKGGAGVTGVLTGLPIEPAVNASSGLGTLFSGNIKAGIGQLMGWTEWAQGTKETSPKAQYSKFNRQLTAGEITAKGVEKLNENMDKAFNAGEIDLKDVERTQLRIKAFNIFKRLNQLSSSGKEKRLDAMEKDVKAEVKKFIQKDFESTAKKGKVPEWKQGEEITHSNFLKIVGIYAKAIGVDPVTAFDRITTGQKIRKIRNNAVIVQRRGLNEEGGSLDLRREFGATEETEVDHIIAIGLGGSGTDQDNIMLLTTERHAMKTRVDNFLIRKLQAGQLTRQKAQNLAKQFVDGDLTENEIKKQVNG